MPLDRNTRFYVDTKGVLYRTLGVGFHLETGAHMVALKQVDNGHTWFLSMAGLSNRHLENGVVIKDYTEVDGDDIDVPGTNNTPRYGESKSPYPGYTDDPRLAAHQGANSGNSIQDGKDNVHRKIQDGYYKK